jgi:hypothetical protein
MVTRINCGILSMYVGAEGLREGKKNSKEQFQRAPGLLIGWRDRCMVLSFLGRQAAGFSLANIIVVGTYIINTCCAI